MPRAKETLDGFKKADSSNIPKLDLFTLICFYHNENFLTVEGRNVKTLRSGRANYGDAAIGRVQLQRRANHICEVRAEITPEHKVSAKPYDVKCIVDEANEIIVEAKCESCPAKNDGCKHAVAFVQWLHRKSEEESVTSVECYWNRALLSTVGSSLRYIKIDSICRQEKVTVVSEDLDNFFKDVCARLASSNSLLIKQLNYRSSYSLHHLMIDFKISFDLEEHNADNFIQYCSSVMTVDVCKKIAAETVGQSSSNKWFNFRYCRVSASKIHEASRCHTQNGSLVNGILGVVKVKDTLAMKRGRDLEGAVLDTLKGSKTKMKRVGFMMSPAEPIFGASPDAILDDCVVEVKCPLNAKSYSTYFKDDKPADKYLAQLTSQMVMWKKKKGLFCVADPDFEKNRKVRKIQVELDEAYASSLFTEARETWKNYLYPILYNSVY